MYDTSFSEKHSDEFISWCDNANEAGAFYLIVEMDMLYDYSDGVYVAMTIAPVTACVDIRAESGAVLVVYDIFGGGGLRNYNLRIRERREGE